MRARVLGEVIEEHEYAVYLSPGYEKDVQWGGYHVTITGFSNFHAYKQDQGKKSIVTEIWKEVNNAQAYSFRNKIEGKDYWIKANSRDKFGRKVYAVCFKSRCLDELGKQLKNKDFKRVKVDSKVNCHKEVGGKCWHITLNKFTEDESTVRQLFDSLKQKDWKLWLVKKPSQECQHDAKGCNWIDWQEI
ncbi:hypothetical protein [Nostoc sp. CALU 1950]|uniref:hypothetical protein n=1 Tax=Nostoc sp. CALU 1950 TaxID=3104321 RepID=UPI003EC0FE23